MSDRLPALKMMCLLLKNFTFLSSSRSSTSSFISFTISAIFTWSFLLNWLFSICDISKRLFIMDFNRSSVFNEANILFSFSSLRPSCCKTFSSLELMMDIGVSSSCDTLAINCFSSVNRFDILNHQRMILSSSILKSWVVVVTFS